MRRIPDLLAFRVEAREAWPPLADLDPFACNLRLEAISRQDIAPSLPTFSASCRTRCASSTYPWRLCGWIRLAAPVMTTGWPDPGRHRRATSRFSGLPTRATSLPAASGPRFACAANALRHGGQRSDLADAIDRANAAALAQRDAGPLLSVLDRDAGCAAGPICRPAMASRRGSRTSRCADGASSSARRAAHFAWTSRRSTRWSIWRAS